MTASDYKIDWIDKKRLKDPMFWFMKASSYSSAVAYIWEKHKKLRSGTKPSHLFNAINATPYLTGLAAELYMKGYLVFKGVSPSVLKKIGHNLKFLRRKCLEYGDTRFESEPLSFLTDTLGEHIVEGGGIRYPDKKPMAIYGDHFNEALGVLRKVSGDIERKLVSLGRR